MCAAWVVVVVVVVVAVVGIGTVGVQHEHSNTQWLARVSDGSE
jgi:hypothetical protein